MPVYIIAGETEGGPVKIGWSVNVEGRRRALQTTSADALRVIRTIEGTPATERWFHERFAAQRVRREWFMFHPDMLTVEPPDFGVMHAKERREQPEPVSWAADGCAAPERPCAQCVAIMRQPDHPFRTKPTLWSVMNA